MLYDEYASYVNTYKAQYDRLVVLYECGSFFELYDDGSKNIDIREIGDLLNIVVSRRNKSIAEVSRANPEMAGFPSHALKKFLGILLNAQYTIVLVTQTTPPPNPKREVTEILSPGTCLDITSKDTNNLMVIYAEETEMYKSHKKHLTLGIAFVDLTTGESAVYEVSSYDRDASYPYDEAFRILSIYNPKELEIGSLKHTASMDALLDFAPQHNRLGRLSPELQKPAYQSVILQKAFPNTGLLSPIEFVGLERKPAALIAFVKLLQFVHSHNETVLKNIKVPRHIEEHAHMQISSNAALQLDIVNANNRALLDILNNTKTAMGRRYFKYRLLNPYVNSAKITELYSAQAQYDSTELQNVREKLAQVYDIERLFRRAVLQIIYPHELYALIESIALIHQIAPFSEYELMNAHTSRFDMEALAKGDLASALRDRELQALNTELQLLKAHFAHLAKTWPCFKVDQTEKEGFFLTTTSKRLQETKHPVSTEFGGHTYHLKDFASKAFTSQLKVFHPHFVALNHQIDALGARIERQAVACFKAFLMEFTACHGALIEKLVKTVQHLDYITTLAYNNQKYKLVRPSVGDAPSFVKATRLRHLLVETHQAHLQYIPNDIELTQEGLLLYGINGSGKSSFMKSIGIAIIMAQAGMYVPASTFEFAPFTRIFTRITTSDDIFRGHSTFTKEVLELRNIMNRADAQSLVIGDELCSGTESISALSIVSAGIITLSQRRSSFVFATHLHDLISIPQVSQIPSLKVAHCSVTYDELSKQLIYDRKLKPGNGSSLYGIEVCKSLHMSPEFLAIANEIRQGLTNIIPSIVAPKTSRYNANVYLDACAICKTPATEVHHIKEQHSAGPDHYIDTFHKNALFNLVALCSTCHAQVHKGTIAIQGYAQTSNGPMLVTKQEITKYMTDTKSTKAQAYKHFQKLYNLTQYRFNKIMN